LGGAEGGALFISLPKAQKTLLAALYSHNRDAKEYLKFLILDFRLVLNIVNFL